MESTVSVFPKPKTALRRSALAIAFSDVTVKDSVSSLESFGVSSFMPVGLLFKAFCISGLQVFRAQSFRAPWTLGLGLWHLLQLPAMRGLSEKTRVGCNHTEKLWRCIGAVFRVRGIRA